MIRKSDIRLFYVNVFAFVALVAAPFAAFAAVDSTLPNPSATASAVSPFMALIPLAVPVLIALLKTAAPKIPSYLLPIIAPLLGSGADIALHYAGVSTLGPLWGAVLGSAGVGLRELQDQLKQVVLPTSDPQQ
jgi:hypothetical protein